MVEELCEVLKLVARSRSASKSMEFPDGRRTSSQYSFMHLTVRFHSYLYTEFSILIFLLDRVDQSHFGGVAVPFYV